MGKDTPNWVDADPGAVVGAIESESQPQTTADAPTHAGMANLVPFKNGHDPRRANSSSAGASLIEWYNRLANSDPPLSLAELQRLGRDPAAPIPKRQAAKSIVRSLRDSFAKSGVPHAASDLDRIADRTHGKAVQRVEVTQKEERDPAALTLELMQLLAEHPELRGALAGEVADKQVVALSDGGVQEGTGGPPMDGQGAGE